MSKGQSKQVELANELSEYLCDQFTDELKTLADTNKIKSLEMWDLIVGMTAAKIIAASLASHSPEVADALLADFNKHCHAGIKLLRAALDE